MIATARSLEKAEKLIDHNIRTEVLDITNPTSIKKFVRRLVGIPVDILINNAGVGVAEKNFKTLKMSEIEWQFQVNCIGTLNIIQALLPHLQKGKRKLVISISSKSGSIHHNVEGTGYGYRASKAALNMVNKNLSIEFESQGFTFVVLHPGSVRTDMTHHSGPLSPRESVEGMLQVIMGLGPQHNGKFVDYQGETIPW